MNYKNFKYNYKTTSETICVNEALSYSHYSLASSSIIPLLSLAVADNTPSHCQFACKSVDNI